MATVDLKAHLTEVAEAIRVKRGHDNLLSPQNFVEEILEIETGTDTSDATAAADEIFAGETAYGPDGKVTGTFTIDNELSKQDDLISQISVLVANKVRFNTLYITSSIPTDDVGVNGDICIVREAVE